MYLRVAVLEEGNENSRGCLWFFILKLYNPNILTIFSTIAIKLPIVLHLYA
jgi:hypothetical protein